MSPCNHKTLTTPFCPLCGKKVSPYPCLNALVVVCRQKAKAAFENADRCRSRFAERQDDYRNNGDEKKAVHFDAECARWREWADALQKLLDAAETEELLK